VSREETDNILKTLTKEQEIIVEDIETHEGTMKAKIKRLAQILEQRIELLDPTLTITISQISTEIRRLLTEKNCAIAPHVNDYLDERYKNQNLARYSKIAENVVDGTIVGSQPLEDLSISDLEGMLEVSKNAKNNADKLVTNLGNNIDNVRAEFLRRGVRQVGDEKYRSPISIYDFKHMVPEDEELQRINEGVVYWIRQQAKGLEDIADLYSEFPAVTVEHATQYFYANKMMATLYTSIKDVKWSGDLSFWFDRNYWAKAQSAHDAGNSTKFDSNLCAYCSRDVDIDQYDYHVMFYDKSSGTGYRCDNCNGTAVLDRETTREQVTDRKPEVERMARDVINHLPSYPEFFQHFRLHYIRDKIMARKTVISEIFSRASMGKEEIVVDPSKLKIKK
jgi:hypothetical protein